jgi:hypothetical protein
MGDCFTYLKKAEGGENPAPMPMKLMRSREGKMRIDQGDRSVITDPAKRQTIVLDHVKKEAMVLPIVDPPAIPSAPGMPAAVAGAAGSSEPPKVEDLGKAVIEGHPVEGKRYTFQPPDKPKPPEMPKPPEAPKSPDLAKAALEKAPKPPEAPKLPEAPKPPEPPPMPVTSEIWTSTKLLMPVLTRTKGDFGEQICHCKYAEGGEPPAGAFEIPAEYKKVPAPEMPKPEIPKAPEAPKMPLKG